MEWRPQYCDKCQKIGHQCQLDSLAREKLPKKRRPWKKVTQTWQYKGPILQQEKKTEQDKVPEQSNENNSSAQRGKQKIEQEKKGDQDKQTAEDINLCPNAGGKQLEFSLSNFPILAAIPVRNGFESLMHSKFASLPIDRGGASKTC